MLEPVHPLDPLGLRLGGGGVDGVTIDGFIPVAGNGALAGPSPLTLDIPIESGKVHTVRPRASLELLACVTRVRPRWVAGCHLSVARDPGSCRGERPRAAGGHHRR